MKKLLYVLVVVGSLGDATVQAVSKATTAAAGSTAGAGAVGMSGNTSTAGGGLNISSSNSSPAIGSGAPQVADSYKVAPYNNNSGYIYSGGKNPKATFLYMMKNNLTNVGYTTLSGIGDDTLFESMREGSIGSYNPKKAFVPSKTLKSGKLDAGGKKVADALTNGVYAINKTPLLAAIKAGVFLETLLLSRLLVQEFFLGRLAPVIQAMAKGGALGKKDQASLTTISDSVGTALHQTRYIRSALQSSTQGNSDTFHIGISQTFSPVDFFVGAIVVNRTTVAIANKFLGVKPGGIGFLPIQSSSPNNSTYMNNWSNTNKASQTGLPTRIPIELGELGSSKHSGGVSLTPLEDPRNIEIRFSGRTYTKESFAPKVMEIFFSSLAPWAIIVEVAGGNPSIVGLAQMSPGSYGKYLTLDGSVGFGTKGSGKFTTLPSNFTLGDVIDAPYNLYADTYATGKTGDLTRYVSGNTYDPYYYVAQSLFNGYLELSEYRTLACVDSTKPSAKSYPLFTASSVALMEPRYTYPHVPQILAKGSGIDWLFLRALRVTKAILMLSGITEDVIDAVDGNNNHVFLSILKDPTADIPVTSANQYFKSSGAHTAGGSTSSGGSNLLQFGSVPSERHSKISKIVKKAIVKKDTAKKTKAKSAIPSGNILYIGATENYLPVILTQNRQQQNQQRGQNGNGYQRGSGNNNQNNNQQRGPSHDNTFNNGNSSTILPSAQGGRRPRRGRGGRRGSRGMNQNNNQFQFNNQNQGGNNNQNQGGNNNQNQGGNNNQNQGGNNNQNQGGNNNQNQGGNNNQNQGGNNNQNQGGDNFNQPLNMNQNQGGNNNQQYGQNNNGQNNQNNNGQNSNNQDNNQNNNNQQQDGNGDTFNQPLSVNGDNNQNNNGQNNQNNNNQQQGGNNNQNNGQYGQNNQQYGQNNQNNNGQNSNNQDNNNQQQGGNNNDGGNGNYE